jgi:hypothetical protein
MFLQKKNNLQVSSFRSRNSKSAEGNVFETRSKKKTFF